MTTPQLPARRTATATATATAILATLRFIAFSAFVTWTALGAFEFADAAANPHASRPEGIAWFDGDVAQAFTVAAQQGKPVFVYFGAVWCPPCQELKATVFRRPDFLGRLKSYVPVYLDGDAPEAQRWAAEFKVSAYPTVLILRDNRAEIERVSGGMDLGRYSEVLELGLAATRPIDAILASLRSDASLSEADCQRLGYNGWGLSAEWLDSENHAGWLADTADALTRAAQRCAQTAAAAARLRVVAMAAALEAEPDAAKPGKQPSAKLAAIVAPVVDLLGDEPMSVAVADELLFVGDAFFMVAVKLNPTGEAELRRRWVRLMDVVATDPRFSVAMQLYATLGKLTASKALEPEGKIPAPLRDEAEGRVTAALALQTDAYTRTSLVSACMNILDVLHEPDRVAALLQAEIKTSSTPYYYMADMAELEEERGHKNAALRWHERAYRESQGQATRFQWGARYVRALLRLRPDDEPAIRAAAQQVLDELAGDGRIYGRSADGLVRLGQSLHKWNAKGQHAAAAREIRAHLAGICARVPVGDPAQVSCNRVLKST